MKKIITIILSLVILINSVRAFTSMQAAFSSFLSYKKIILPTALLQRLDVDDKNGLIECKLINTRVQFGKYNSMSNEIYVFNYFADTSFNQPGISIGCYTFVHNNWIEVTDAVMPAINFYDYYGTTKAPPKMYANAVQYRFLLHKNKTLQIVIEPRVKGQDARFDRVYDQRRYAAASTRWNKKEGRFELTKWLK